MSTARPIVACLEGVRKFYGAVPTLGGLDLEVHRGALLHVLRLPEVIGVREHPELFASHYPNPMLVDEVLA